LVDGPGDHGIDFWFPSDAGVDIYQCKSHELSPNDELDLFPFDNEGVVDLQRAKSLLLSQEPLDLENKALKNFLHYWNHAIAKKRLSDASDPVLVNLALVILGEQLTRQAEGERKSFVDSLNQPAAKGNVNLEFRFRLVTVQDLLDNRWRLDNRQWTDLRGSKKETVDLYPEQHADHGQEDGSFDEKIIIRPESAVFYCRAIDLVTAYGDFGYQLFEPNVRCNITHSKVNSAIRKTLQHRPTREQFRILNNGVTIIAEGGYTKPSANRPCFRVTRPGIVNGLQTVFALYEAHKGLSDQDQQHFETNCYVLVRLLQRYAIKDIGALVRATNTQNPMQARNLVSNNAEQMDFERLFAQIGWFYERKQGAWEAFALDPKRWRSLPNEKRADFQVSGSTGRPRIKRVDNEALAQAWLAFVGFSEEAVHSKRDIFELDKPLYDFIFNHTPISHGFEHQYKLDKALEHSRSDAPDPKLMLLAYLAREMARKLAPTAKENRENAVKRLNLHAKSLSKEQLDGKLSEDSEYLLGQILNGMSFVFTEFVGMVLFRALGDSLLPAAPALLNNGSFGVLLRQLDFDGVRQSILDQRFEKSDVLAVVWWTFRHLLEEMVGGAWLASYRTARNRTRFNHSVDTRNRLHKGVLQFHDFTMRTQFARPWAIGIEPNKGLLGLIGEVSATVEVAKASGRRL